MSKMAELDAAVVDLRRCCEALSGVSDALHELFSSGEEQPETTVSKPVEKALTIEDMRPILAKKGLKGHDIQALIHKYDAKKHNEVDPAHYADLLREAEVL